MGIASAETSVRAMASAIAHRGPDSMGLWADGPGDISLGHTRLSIIDLSTAGHQPMQSGSGRYVMAFNGEVYNHLDLRTELVTRVSGNAQPNKTQWRGSSDTESLLAAFECWGIEETLQRCVGMFAVAV